ncbi:LysR family transcriptional regulator [Streptomyces sp. NPDC088387]|uniref:LysR family transcriptional regulator n=1 Tax=Streptomyces sp. NPDC088387 TaxID=3365859 RepID=UPI003803BE6C
MDLLGACRAFVHVSEHGSFTVGAAAARMAQSVASRRVAALEQHFGERLLSRSSRTVTLTPFGRDVLPLARQLVQLGDRLEHEAEAARHRPLRLAVPHDCPPGALARLIADAQRHGVPLDPHPAPPAERAELLRSREVRAALLAVPPDAATWTVPLGLAVADVPGGGPIYVDTLRPGRADGDRRARRIWLQPEDDVPHIRDRMARLRDSVGLRPAQLVVAGALTDVSAASVSSSGGSGSGPGSASDAGGALARAAAEVLAGHGDALLCSPVQAASLALHWRPIGELNPALARGYALVAAEDTEMDVAGPEFGTGAAVGTMPSVGAGTGSETGAGTGSETGAGTGSETRSRIHAACAEAMAMCLGTGKTTG